MSNFWLGLAAAQAATRRNNRTEHSRHQIASILGGLALALLIGAALLILAAFNA
jgi:hypothetical protein